MSSQNVSYSHNVLSAVWKLTQRNVFFYYLTLSFIVIHILNSKKKQNTFELSKILFRKHSTWTFECYFERHKFDSIINRGKLVQKTYWEQFFWKTLNYENIVILEVLCQSSKNEKTVSLFWFLKKKAKKNSSPWKIKNLEKAVLRNLNTSYI